MPNPATLQGWAEEIKVLCHSKGWWKTIETPAHACMRLVQRTSRLYACMASPQRMKDSPMTDAEDTLASIMVLTLEIGGRIGVDMDKALARKFGQLKMEGGTP